MIQLTLGKSFRPGKVITHSALKEYEMKLHLTDIFNFHWFSAFIYSSSFVSCHCWLYCSLPTQKRKFNKIVLHSIDQKNLVLCLIYLVSLKHNKIQHSCFNVKHGPRGTGEGVKCVGKEQWPRFCWASVSGLSHLFSHLEHSCAQKPKYWYSEVFTKQLLNLVTYLCE